MDTHYSEAAMSSSRDIAGNEKAKLKLVCPN